jgi:hypothetical protein
VGRATAVKLISKLFWRIIFPLFLGLVIFVMETIQQRRHNFFFSADEVDSTDELTRRNMHEWGKEAEVFESRIKEADEIEKERRRRASWIER